MIFKGVEFDDYTECEDGTWSQVCEGHYFEMVSKGVNGMEPYPLDDCICGVKGCNETAKYYIDF
jgi:hypothetical protein